MSHVYELKDMDNIQPTNGFIYFNAERCAPMPGSKKSFKLSGSITSMFSYSIYSNRIKCVHRWISKWSCWRWMKSHRFSHCKGRYLFQYEQYMSNIQTYFKMTSLFLLDRYCFPLMDPLYNAKCSGPIPRSCIDWSTQRPEVKYKVCK